MAAVFPALALTPVTAIAATGSTSVLEYSQCQNGSVPSTSTACTKWGNGILNSSNSHYAEDGVTPQRLILNSAAGTNHTVTIRYMTRKGSANVHAYDSLATWNVTQTTANRCQGLKSGVCPGGSASVMDMKSDPAPVEPSAIGISNVTSAHELPQSSRQWVMYGGTITAATTPVHTADPADTTSDFAKVTVSFTSNASKVMLLFGGHLAPSEGPRGWGSGLGAASINGGPYHIILDALDGASGGGRDNQIMAGAIQGGSSDFTVTKTANPALANPGQLVTYTITVTNNGTVAGATAWTDDFDDRLSPSTAVSNPAGNNCTYTTVSGNKLFSNCGTAVLAANGGSQTFTYTATMPPTFTTGAGTDGCPSGTFPVRNRVTLTSGATDTALVCVTAAPDFQVTKTANPTTAIPGQTVTYTILVENKGTAAGSDTWDDDFDDRLTPSTATTTGGPNCTSTTVSGNKKFDDCATGTINAGASKTWTYTANMPTTFSGTPGTGCEPGGPQQFPVRNVVVMASGDQDDETVCVNPSATFTVTKTANPTTTTPGGLVTYTIVVSNTGNGPGSTTWDDDFDDRLSPSTATSSDGGPTCTSTTVSGNKLFDNCASGTIDPGTSNTWTYTATMPTSFTGAPGGNGCPAGPTPPGQYPVRNVVVLASGGTDDAVVCVNAAPSFHVTKTANPTTANAGQTVTYTIVVSNTGTAAGSDTWDDDFDNRLTPSTATTTGGPNCTFTTVSGNKLFDNCATGTIAAGGSKTWTYTAAMPTSFTGSPGGNGCPAGPTPPGQFPVRNVVVMASGDTDDSVVCVNATPTFTVTKTANPTTTNPGGLVTYTIVVSNGGTAAGSTTWDDDFDDRLSPSTATSSDGGPTCTSTTVSGNKKFDDCPTGTINAGASKTWTYTATMPSSFTGAPGGNGCNPAGTNQQYPVRNVVVLASGGTDDAVVCVNAAPSFHVTKTANPTTANPGDPVTYTIVVSNTGTAPGSDTWDDDFDDRLNPSTATTPGGPNCTSTTVSGNKKFDDCATGTIAAGGSKTWTYTANMPTSFTGTPGGNGCNPAGTNQQYPVRNVVVMATGDTDDAVVCVRANPDLTFVKSVTKSTNALGQEVLTYKLTYTNNGAAEATSATIAETVPSGTAFDGCSDNCATSGSPVSGVTWTVGPIAPKGGTGFVTLRVVVTTTSACSISNTATITTTGFNGGNPFSSNTLVTPVTPAPDPDHANTSGSSFGAQITTYTVLDGVLTPVLQPLKVPSATAQSGVGGPVIDSDQFLSLDVPVILHADAMRTTSRSEITRTPAQASSTATSEVLGLCVVQVLLDCAVKADVVRAVAYAQATGTAASISADGSVITNLKVSGQPVIANVDLTQTTIVPLPAAVFGSGSYVAINERTGGTSLSGGAYRADIAVNMIRVHVTGALGVVKVDVTVAHAEAHADFPQLLLCGPQATQSVSGHAFIADVAVLPPLVLATQGFVGIPASGGSASQDLVGVNLVDGTLLTTGVASSSSVGTIGAAATSTSRASVADVCLLKFANSTQCVVMAQALKSVSTSTANGTASSTDAVSATDKTEFVNLEVRSAPGVVVIPVPINPPPNTRIEIPGIGVLILNEQFCDNGSDASNSQPRCSGTSHSGLTVRALHLILLRNFGPFNPGVEVIVSEAHSDATYN